MNADAITYNRGIYDLRNDELVDHLTMHIVWYEHSIVGINFNDLCRFGYWIQKICEHRLTHKYLKHTYLKY